MHTLVKDQLETKTFQRGIWHHMFCCIGIMAGRRVDDIEGKAEGLVQHLWDDATEQGTGQLQAWVCVDFDEPRVEISINHEVQSENFKVVFVSFRRELDE